MKAPSYTPAPWRADGLTIETLDGGNIGLMNLARKKAVSEANAAFIVLAVNNHEALIEALRAIADQEFIAAHSEETRMKDMADIARAALARAGGK